MNDDSIDEKIKVDEDTETFKCPSCGGNMNFDPESISLLCLYCGNKIVIPENNTDILEYNFDTSLKDESSDWGNEIRSMTCDNCGAKTVFDNLNSAQNCVFCGSAHVTKYDSEVGIVPKSLIPFKISEKQAKAAFITWIKKRSFAPKALKTNYLVNSIKGVYMPFWTYDSNTLSNYIGEGGTYYYVTQTYTTQVNGKTVVRTRQVRHIRWWPTGGDYSYFFNDILIKGSNQIEEKHINKIKPFKLEHLVSYKPDYLAGFFAELYSIGLNDGWKSAVNIIDGEVKAGVIKKINADEVRNLKIDTQYNDIKYKHLLLPFWISAYTYKNKVYKFIINAQTGKSSGEAPVSALKVTLLIISILAIIALVIFFVSSMGQSNYIPY